MPSPRAVLAAAVAVLSTAALLAPPASATPEVPATPRSDAVAAPVWGTCTSAALRAADAQCATIAVPLDHDRPTGPKIRIAVSRIRHTTKAYQGVMLVNPGGPGGSGLGLAVLKDYVPHGGGDSYDWIGFDPRGVGASEPRVSCDPRYVGFDRPRYAPSSPAVSEAWFARTKAYTDACAKKNGPILDHLTTVDSARDLESIRVALGEKKISYYGFSYGTYLGQVYGTLFPTRLRRVVFDGTVDPRKIWYDANLDQDAAFDANIDRWFAWLAKYDSTYHLGRTQKAVRSRYYRTEEALYRDPVKVKGGAIGGSEWVDAFLPAAYDQSTWTDLAETFAGFVRDDDAAGLRAAYLEASGYPDDNGYAVYLGVQCTDASWPQSWRTWERDAWRTFADAPYETWSNTWFNEPCRHWPAEAHRELAIDGSKVTSVLMVNETLDAATPYAGSLEVRRRFPGARLVAEPGGTTHAGSLGGNDCVDDRISAYLATGRLPARKTGRRADVTCAPLPQPTPASSADRAGKAGKAAKATEAVAGRGGSRVVLGAVGGRA